MSFCKKKHNIPVRYGETDQMGYVYHGNYAQFLEIGRIEWLRSMGFSYSKMEKDGILLPVLKLELDFKKSAFFDDTLTIQTSLREIPSYYIEFDYLIVNQHNDLLCTAYTRLVFLASASRKPIRCPKNILEAIKKESDSYI
jgi:acyl-CoA thioester hydrolase